MDEFGDRLRQQLQEAAGDAGVRPDLRDVQSRAHRQRLTAGALGGGASLAVVALAIAVAAVLPLAPEGGVELDPDPPEIAEEPEGREAPAEQPDERTDDAEGNGGEADPTQDGPAAPSDACGSPEQLAAVVATRNGGLEALCGDGDAVPLIPEGEARNPAFAPDGSAIIYEDAGEDAPVLRRMDTASGEVTELGNGRMPAFSSEGLLAWVEGEELSPSVMVGEPGQRPVAEHFMGTIAIRDLAWHPDGDTLYLVDNAPEGGGLSALDAMDPDQPATPVLPSDAADGGRVLAVAASRDAGALGVVTRLGTDAGLELATAEGPSLEGQLDELTGLADLTQLDLAVEDLSRAQDEGRLWLADGEGLQPGDADAPGLGGSGKPSWLLGDGEAVWVISADGSHDTLVEGAQRAAANPAFSTD